MLKNQSFFYYKTSTLAISQAQICSPHNNTRSTTRGYLITNLGSLLSFSHTIGEELELVATFIGTMYSLHAYHIQYTVNVDRSPKKVLTQLQTN